MMTQNSQQEALENYKGLGISENKQKKFHYKVQQDEKTLKKMIKKRTGAYLWNFTRYPLT